MAPPAHRRPGNSRRAQYSAFLGYVAGGVGAAIGAALLIIAIRDPSFLSGLRGAGAQVASPLSRVASEGKADGANLIETIGGYFAAGSRNVRLTRELEIAKTRLVEAEATAEENRRLKSLLGLSSSATPQVANARLVGSTSTSTRRFATLGAGHANGVRSGQPVRSPLGLVGRVLEVAPTTSRVLLITDSESVVPIRRTADGIPAYAQGRGDGTLSVRLISLGINPLKPGDIFVTSGSGGIYPPGIPVAAVVRKTRDGAVALALSDPASSDYVAVLQMWTADGGRMKSGESFTRQAATKTP